MRNRWVLTMVAVGLLAGGSTIVTPPVLAAPASSHETRPDQQGPWGPSVLIDPPAGHPKVISCAPDGFCMVVDRFGNVVTRTEGTWGQASRVFRFRPNALSCTSATFCVAVGPKNHARVFDGTSWTAPTRITASRLVGVSCVSSQFCVAITSRAETTYNGSTWSHPRRIDERTVALRVVACPSPTLCLAGDKAGRYTEYDGHAWSGLRHTSLADFYQLSCGETTFCLAMDPLGDVARFDGSGWRTAPRPPVSPGLLSCASSTLCVFAGGGKASTFDGERWSKATALERYDIFPGVSCATENDCVVIDQSGFAITYDGTQWSPPDLIDAPRGGSPSISCPTTTFCAVVDASGGAVTYDGSSWGQSSVIDPNQEVNASPAVSCASSTFCVAVDEANQVLRYDGSTWSDPLALEDDFFITGVACPSATFCVASGAIKGSGDESQGAVSMYDGTSWTAPIPVDPPDFTLSTVSCSSPTSCAALGYGRTGDHAVTWDGTSWSSEVRVSAEERPIFALSCASPTFCLGLDDSSRYLVFDGNGWSMHHGKEYYDYALSVSCPTSTFCVMVAKEDIQKFDGHTWSAPERIDYEPLHESQLTYLTTVSCPTISFCVAADYRVRAFMTTKP